MKLSEINSFLILLLGLITSIPVSAQDEVEPLKKGDIIPDITVKYQLGDETKTFRFHKNKRKLVIIDFWIISCSSCIFQMPHMAELQKEFGEEVEILVVTKEKREAVQNMIARMKRSKRFDIYNAFRNVKLVTEDSMLTRLFEHPGYPSHIWLKDGLRFAALTFSNSTTSDNITAFMENRYVKLDEMDLRTIDKENPITWFDSSLGFPEKLQSYSAFFSRVEHSTGGNRSIYAKKDPATGNVKRLNILNATIGDLYKVAYFRYQRSNILVSDSKLFLETNDKTRFVQPTADSMYFEWVNKNLYSYVVELSDWDPEMIYKKMIGDLDLFFKLKSEIGKRMVRCFVLREKDSTVKRLVTKYNEPHCDIVATDTGVQLVLYKSSVAELYNFVLEFCLFKDSSVPVINETFSTHEIDVVIPWSFEHKSLSLDLVKKGLARYGLVLEEEQRLMDVIILSDD